MKYVLNVTWSGGGVTSKIVESWGDLMFELQDINNTAMGESFKYIFVAPERETQAQNKEPEKYIVPQELKIRDEFIRSKKQPVCTHRYQNGCVCPGCGY